MTSVISILRNWNPCALLEGIEEGVAKMECDMVFPHMSKRRATMRLVILPMDIHPRCKSKDLNKYLHNCVSNSAIHKRQG